MDCVTIQLYTKNTQENTQVQNICLKCFCSPTQVRKEIYRIIGNPECGVREYQQFVIVCCSSLGTNSYSTLNCLKKSKSQ